jgi:DNA-binding transcriptional LysR family regulator
MRVLIAGLPKLLNDVVVSLVADLPDIDLACDSGRDLVEQVRDGAIDAVVTMATPTLALSLLQTSPGLRVISVTPEARTGFLWQMRPYQEFLGELSGEGLSRALRKPVAELTGPTGNPSVTPATGRGGV